METTPKISLVDRLIEKCEKLNDSIDTIEIKIRELKIKQREKYSELQKNINKLISLQKPASDQIEVSDESD